MERGHIVVNDLPITLEGVVIKGFGRGSKQLGCPTANIPIEPYENLLNHIPNGVYYGLGSFIDRSYQDGVFAVALSIGWNPYYKNEKKTIEAHFIHQFDSDFYGQEIRLEVLGFIRPESDFKSLDDLIQAIKDDISFAKERLEGKITK